MNFTHYQCAINTHTYMHSPPNCIQACKLYKETIEIVEGYDEKAEAMEKQRKQQQMVADYERKKNGTYVTDATSPTSNNGAHTTGAAKTGRTTTATDQAVYDALFRLQIDTGNNLSAALYQRGEWRKAQDTCATVLTLAPNNVKALHKTGRICMQLNDWLEARIALEKALAILSPYSSSTSLASSASSASVVPMDVPEEHKGCGAEAEREKREREEGQKKYAQIKKDLVLLLHRKKQYLASQKQQYGNMFKGKKGREQGNGGQPQRKNPVKAPAGKRPGRSDPEDDSIFHDNVKSSSGHGVSTDSKSTSNETKDTCTGRVQEESEVKANTNISSPPTPKHAAGEPEKTSPSSSPDLPASPFITQLTYQLIPAILLLAWAFYMKR